MKKITRLLFLAGALMFTAFSMAQTTVTGTIMDAEMGAPLPGANIVEKGTTNGVSSDFNGYFTIITESTEGEIEISYVGYGKVLVKFSGSTSLGEVTLSSDNSLEEVVIIGSGIIDLAEDRKTPVAVSTITANQIREKAGNSDLPEVLKSTPSVQSVQAGGFGDGQMFLRGFDQTNTAFLLNGQPINGMEDGKMYWSNWSGVLDVANAVQVQRGLGASKLAISSVGGTVNIVTKTIDRREGGFVQQMVGNDNYIKSTAYYSTGVNEKGWSFGALFGYWQGDGYVDYTQGQGQTYYISVGYQPNDNHSLNFMLTGAPQWHVAAGSASIGDFLENERGRRFNGWYEEGVNSPNNVAEGIYPGGRNIYHKPVANLSWDWTINDKSELSTVLYGSMGRGAFAAEKISDGVGYVRGSYNNHNWYGLVSNYNNQLTENLNFNIGADVRLYNGIHFRGINEFIGQTSLSLNNNPTSSTYNSYIGEPYTITNTYGGINPWGMLFNPNTEHDQRMDRDYEEQINYYGVFGQIEYSKDQLSAFFQGALSNQSHEREEFFFTENIGESETSEKINNVGFNVKAGAAYEITDMHKVFVNAGFYSRQPFHDDLFVNTRNSNDLINPEVENQEITGLEAGYQFGGERIQANVNLYHTTWAKRTLLNDNGKDQDTPEYESYQTQGVKQVHMGVELEVFTQPLDNLRVNGFLSLGDWQYKDSANKRTFDSNGDQIGDDVVINIDGFNVGGAAQVNAGINASFEFLPRLSVDGAWNWYNDMYSIGDPEDPTIAMPSYDMVDTGLSYRMYVGKDDRNSLQFRININNVFDEVYLESVNGTKQVNATDGNYKGVNTTNTGRFGYGRTWNTSIRFNF